MAEHKWPHKDPDEVLDYTHDWGLRIDTGDTITSVIALADTASGIVVDSTTVSGAIQTVWLSGGTIGRVAEITLRAITAGGRTHEEGARVRLRKHGS